MSEYTHREIAVGAFVAAGIVVLGYLALSLGGLSLFRSEHYVVRARFASVGDLRPGALVKIAGVRVGEVESIDLAGYVAGVELSIEDEIALPADTMASIRTAGLLGESYVSLTPGGALENLEPGAQVARTEPAVDLLELIAEYAFGSPTSGRGDRAAGKPEEPGAGDDGTEDSPFEDPL